MGESAYLVRSSTPRHQARTVSAPVGSLLRVAGAPRRSLGCAADASPEPAWGACMTTVSATAGRFDSLSVPVDIPAPRGGAVLSAVTPLNASGEVGGGDVTERRAVWTRVETGGEAEQGAVEAVAAAAGEGGDRASET